MNIHYHKTIDLRGDQCPVPLIESSKAIKSLDPGQVLKVVVHPRGSISIQGLSMTAKNVEQIAKESIQENGRDLFVHYLRRIK
jgi:TusA-related sulfurtransferase